MGCVCTQYRRRAGTVAPTGRVICSLVCVHVRARGPGAGGAVFGVEVCVCVAVSVCGVGVLGVGLCRVCVLEDIVMQSRVPSMHDLLNVRAISLCALSWLQCSACRVGAEPRGRRHGSLVVRREREYVRTVSIALRPC